MDSFLKLLIASVSAFLATGVLFVKRWRAGRDNAA